MTLYPYPYVHVLEGIYSKSFFSHVWPEVGLFYRSVYWITFVRKTRLLFLSAPSKSVTSVMTRNVALFLSSTYIYSRLSLCFVQIKILLVVGNIGRKWAIVVVINKQARWSADGCGLYIGRYLNVKSCYFKHYLIDLRIKWILLKV